MDNNRLLKKIAIIHGLRHFEMQEVFALGDLDCSSSRIKSWMAGRSNKNYEPISDEQFEKFLNGLIIYSRGAVDEPDVLPRGIEHFILGLIDNRNGGLLDELEALVADARDALENEVSN